VGGRSHHELRTAWRERLTASESHATISPPSSSGGWRAELHELVDRLSPQDLDAALTIARRLFENDRGR